MRTLRWGFIFFQCLWLNVVVPGHTRGAMPMPGTKSVGTTITTDGGCCKTKLAKSDSKDQQPLDKSRCAVCHYAIGLALPPVFSFDHRPTGLLAVLPIPVARCLEQPDLQLTFFGRGPPVM